MSDVDPLLTVALAGRVFTEESEQPRSKRWLVVVEVQHGGTVVAAYVRWETMRWLAEVDQARAPHFVRLTAAELLELRPVVTADRAFSVVEADLVRELRRKSKQASEPGDPLAER